MKLRFELLACLLFAGCGTPPVEKPPAPATPAEKPAPVTSAGPDLVDQALAAMRLQAQIDRQTEEFQKRPRKKFIGARASEYRFAAYEEEWRAKVERVGAANFPPEARGKAVNLRVTVSIRSDGTVESIQIDRSSGDEVIDRAVTRVIEKAAPFAPFPPDIARDTDLLVITRTWFFGAAVTTE